MPSAAFNKVIDRLNTCGCKPRVNGTHAQALCPAHDDSDPSLSIDQGDDGRVLVKCFASCDVHAICGKLGLSNADLFEPNTNGHAAHTNGKAKPAPRATKLHKDRESAIKAVTWAVQQTHGTDYQCVAQFTYFDANGTVVGAILRFEPPEGGSKTFRPIHPSGDGWRAGDPPCPWPLYRLPNLREGTVFTLEGEGKTDLSRSIGLNAIATAHGAKSPHMTELSPLAGRDVVIVIDNDDAGRKYGETLTTLLMQLVPVVTSVRILSLPDLAEGADIVEFIEDRRTDGKDDKAILTEILDLAKYAPLPTTTLTTDDMPECSLIVRPASAVECRKVTWMWDYRFVAGAINLLVGMPDCGKSVLTIDIAARVSRGTPWPPVKGVSAPNICGSVAFLSIEDSPETTIVPRLKSSGADLTKVHIVEGVMRDNGEKRQRDSFDIQRDVQELEQLRRQLGDLRLVIIDPLDSYLNARLDTGVGNKVRAALWPLKDWAEATGVTVLIVHHFNKTATTNAIDKVSGARSFGALPRTVWAAGRDEDMDRTILAPVKANLVKREDKKALSYSLISSLSDPDTPIVAWHDDVLDVTANQLLGAPRETKTNDSIDFLRDILRDGPMDSGEIQRLVEANGDLSWRTVSKKETKDRAGVICEQRREHGKVAGWTWRLAKP